MRPIIALIISGLIFQINLAFCQSNLLNLDGYYILINGNSCLSCKGTIKSLIDSNPEQLNKLLITGIRDKDISSYMKKEFGSNYSDKLKAESATKYNLKLKSLQPELCLIKNGKLIYSKEIDRETTIWSLLDSVELDEKDFKIPEFSGLRWEKNNLYILNPLENDVAIYNVLNGKCISTLWKSNIRDTIWKRTVALIQNNLYSDNIYNVLQKRAPQKIVEFTELTNLSVYNNKVFVKSTISFPFITSNGDTPLYNADFIFQCDSSLQIKNIFNLGPFEVDNRFYFMGRYSSVFNFTFCDDSTFFADISERSNKFDSVNSPYIGKVRLQKNSAILLSHCNIPKPFIEGNYGYDFQGGTTLNTPIGFLAIFISLPFEFNLTSCKESDLFNRMNYYNSLLDKGNYIYNRKEKILSYSPYFNSDTKKISVVTREKDHFYFNRRNLIDTNQNIEKYNFDSVMTGVSYFHQEGDHYWTLKLQNENWIIHHGKLPF